MLLNNLRHRSTGHLNVMSHPSICRKQRVTNSLSFCLPGSIFLRLLSSAAGPWCGHFDIRWEEVVGTFSRGVTVPDFRCWDQECGMSRHRSCATHDLIHYQAAENRESRSKKSYLCSCNMLGRRGGLAQKFLPLLHWAILPIRIRMREAR